MNYIGNLNGQSINTSNDLDTLKYNYWMSQVLNMQQYSQLNNNTPRERNDFSYNNGTINMGSGIHSSYGSNNRSIEQNYTDLQLEYIKNYAQKFTEERKEAN